MLEPLARALGLRARPEPACPPGLPLHPAEGGEAAFRYLLVLRAALLNLVALALVAAAALQGLVTPLFAADTTRITAAILLVFAAGLATCLRRIAQLSRELNEVKSADPDPGSRTGRFLGRLREADPQARAALAGALRLKLASRIAGVRQFANNLVLLGLVGTVVGFVVALSGVDPATAGDPSALAPMVSRLIEGMGVALYTTLVGSVLNIWLMLNCRLLETAATSFLTQLVERAEAASHA